MKPRIGSRNQALSVLSLRCGIFTAPWAGRPNPGALLKVWSSGKGKSKRRVTIVIISWLGIYLALRKGPPTDGNRRATQAIVRVEAVLRAVRWFVGLGLIFSAGLSGAATHPVPLDKNTDSAKCIECHEDKAKGKAVHSAIAMGCTSCHEIRVTKDVTRVKLTTTTPYALCLTCHADKNAAGIKGTVHPPAVRDCLKCHDPHTAANKNQLLKPTSGGANENPAA